MGTLTITASGFSTLPATPPSTWPSGVTWPNGQSPNGAKSYTVSDADWQSLLAWAAATNFDAGTTPTAAQILLAWLQTTLVSATISQVQSYSQLPRPAPPAPIVVA